MTIQVDIADEQELRPIDDALAARLAEAVRTVAADYGFRKGEISLAILDDAAIRVVNRDFLKHDWATDAITFPFEASHVNLEGEILVSRETADRVAASLAWSGDDELLLYVIHGTLHLVGLDDQDDQSRANMKLAERKYLIQFNVPQAETHQ
ncbi:MAG: rRNA maturation RNase YbeY [Pirellulaceae bacterium]|nr:rRNA maturation RNase YbeY [Pirellulaceae bacterium]